jgi:hypothetical protein
VLVCFDERQIPNPHTHDAEHKQQEDGQLRKLVPDAQGDVHARSKSNDLREVKRELRFGGPDPQIRTRRQREFLNRALFQLLEVAARGVNPRGVRVANQWFEQPFFRRTEPGFGARCATVVIAGSTAWSSC